MTRQGLEGVRGNLAGPPNLLNLGRGFDKALAQQHLGTVHYLMRDGIGQFFGIARGHPQ